MKRIPFYSNDESDMRCMVAVIRSALEYFTHDTYSWEKMDELTGYNGRPVWTARTWSYLAIQGFDIRMIEAFDYNRFAKEGKTYLKEYLKPEELEWQLTKTDIMKLPDSLPQFLKNVDHETRSPNLLDLDAMLDEGYLVATSLNSRVLNSKPGYSSHMILVHEKDNSDYIAHDPGLPAIANRRIDRELLWTAMGKENNRVEMTGIKRRYTSV